MAALQGVDLDGEETSNAVDDVSTVEEVKARAFARMTGDKDMAGAISQGLTPEFGVTYKIVEGTELG